MSRDPRRRTRPGGAPSADRATARQVALDVVLRVTDEGAYSNLVLGRTLERARLSERDARLASELAYGTLRRLVRIDRALEPLLERPLHTSPKRARAALRLGAHQLLFTRVPPHAAVSETVRLVDGRHRGFVNAVLRRLSTTPAEEPTGTTDDAVAGRTGLVEWAVRELRALLGEEAEDAARALAEPGPITLRVNRCRSSPEAVRRRLLEVGIGAGGGTLHEDSLLLDEGNPARLPGFAEGLFTVQDQASSFVVRALDPAPGERVLDVCSAPGGKAAHLSCLVGEGGEVVAGDASAVRLALVRETLDRLGVRARLLVQDGRRPALRPGYDAVLVDAPCSGIGSARRRPELLWRTGRDDVSGLARLQVGLATAAAELLRPGGRMVYSVCTFPRAETDAVCDATLRRRPDIEPLELQGPEGPAPRIRLWPHTHGCDAMFVAGFRRADTPRA